jgi:hypothetical protein
MKLKTGARRLLTEQAGGKAVMLVLGVVLATFALRMGQQGGVPSTAGPTSGADTASATSPSDCAPSRPPQAATTTGKPNPADVRTRSSSLLRYRISYPAGWHLCKATSAWVFTGSVFRPAVAQSDVYRSPGRQAFLVSSQKLPRGMSSRQWLRSYVGDGVDTSSTCWPAPADWPTTRMAGHVAYLHGEDLFCDFTEAVTFVDGRAYVFTGSAGNPCCRVFDMTRFKAFLATVRFPSDTFYDGTS